MLTSFVIFAEAKQAKDRQTETQRDGEVDRQQTDRQADIRQTDRKTDKQTDRQKIRINSSHVHAVNEDTKTTQQKHLLIIQKTCGAQITVTSYTHVRRQRQCVRTAVEKIHHIIISYKTKHSPAQRKRHHHNNNNSRVQTAVLLSLPVSRKAAVPHSSSHQLTLKLRNDNAPVVAVAVAVVVFALRNRLRLRHTAIPCVPLHQRR